MSIIDSAKKLFSTDGPANQRIIGNVGAGAVSAIAAGVVGAKAKTALLTGVAVTAGLQLFGLKKKGA